MRAELEGRGGGGGGGGAGGGGGRDLPVSGNDQKQSLNFRC